MGWLRGLSVHDVRRQPGRFLNSTTGLLLSLVTLTLLGAFVFTRIEAPAEVQTRVQATKARQRIFVLAQELAEEGEKADWSKLVVQVNKYRDKLKQAWKAGNDELGNAVVPPSWSLWGSIYYCITLITTIGYGNVCPHTTIGRVLTIGYCLLAIPLCTLVFSRISKIIVRFLKAINLMTLESSGIPVGLRDAYSRADTTFDFSFLTCMALLVGYFSLSGVIYCWGIGPTADEWSPFDAVYFSFISMTSIGLGDIVPTSETFLNVASLLYILFGLILMNLVFTRMVELMEAKLEAISSPEVALVTKGLSNRFLKDSVKRQALTSPGATNTMM
nr:unnamed protein product [Spirometra erinaceieuropaei]